MFPPREQSWVAGAGGGGGGGPRSPRGLAAPGFRGPLVTVWAVALGTFVIKSHRDAQRRELHRIEIHELEIARSIQSGIERHPEELTRATPLRVKRFSELVGQLQGASLLTVAEAEYALAHADRFVVQCKGRVRMRPCSQHACAMRRRQDSCRSMRARAG